MKHYVKRDAEGNPVAIAKSETANYPDMAEVSESELEEAKAEMVSNNSQSFEDRVRYVLREEGLI